MKQNNRKRDKWLNMRVVLGFLMIMMGFGGKISKGLELTAKSIA